MSGYSNWITAVTELMGGYTVTDATSATPTNDADFNSIIAPAIADAEGMMYRDPDLDFLQTRGTDSTQVTVAGSRFLPIPTTMLTIEQVCLMIPAGSTPITGTRVQLSRVTPEWLNSVYPTDSFSATPQYGQTYFAQENMSVALIGPTTDQAYTAEYWGVKAQTPLSATNPNSVLTNFFPDCFLAASMIFMSGFMKAFASNGGAPDNASQGVNWQTHYADLKKGAAFISARQRWLSAGATAYPPAPQSATAR